LWPRKSFASRAGPVPHGLEIGPPPARIGRGVGVAPCRRPRALSRTALASLAVIDIMFSVTVADACVTLGVTLVAPFPLGSGLFVTSVTSVTTIDLIAFFVTLGDGCDACGHVP
jgi:hypothetical protein